VFSALKTFKFGLPQGGVTSSTYYNIFTADIPKHKHCRIALFADDTSIYCTSSKFQIIYGNLQDYLASLEQFFFKWKIKSYILHSKKEKRTPQQADQNCWHGNIMVEGN
jgi:hypothetical protein